jgi:hypothetical protein
MIIGMMWLHNTEFNRIYLEGTIKIGMDKLAIVEFSLLRASTGPDAIASKIPYISMFAAKLCSIHL